MKRLLKSPLRPLRRFDFFLTLLPLLIWIGLTRLRSWLIAPRCRDQPDLHCIAQDVFWLDRPFLHYELGWAEELSLWAQNFSGVLAFLIWATFSLRKRLGSAVFLRGFTVLLHTLLWNGAITEAVRVTFQRARPFVYADPSRLGSDPAHYTSFYSGHTSFSAAILTAALVLLTRHAASPLWRRSIFSLGFILVAATGLGRVLSGRHFPTDVLTAVLGGIATALAVAWLHRPLRDTANP